MEKIKKTSQIISLILICLFFTNCAPKKTSDEPTTITARTQVETAQPELPPLENVPAQPGIDDDMSNFHEREIRGLSYQEMLRRNEVTIQALYRTPLFVDQTNSHHRARVGQITPEIAQKLYDSVLIHPVISDTVKERYDQPGVEIGYCFGRALYVHLALLKMGVAKEAIRKVWLVGTLYKPRTPINWDFHVATAVKATNGKWYVIDHIPGRLMTVDEWYAFYIPLSYRKQTRFYYTEAEKFHSGSGGYTRSHLGLDTSEANDWYRHYFVNLMEWFRMHSLAEVGLPTDLRS